MALNRWRVRFDGAERVDLPDFRQMMNRAYADFDLLIKAFIDNQAAPRIVKRYQQGTHTTNLFKIAKDVNRAFLDINQQWLYVNVDAAGTTQNLAVPNSSTSYVSVRLSFTNDDLQTRAFWDTDIGLTGQEYFDEINVRTRLDEEFNVNQIGFASQSAGWIPLFTVVVDGTGNITSVTRMDDLLWKPRAYSLPAPSSRNNVFEADVQDLRSFIDLVGALQSEVKGTGSVLVSAPWSSLKLLREYQNIFVSGGGNIEWEGDQGVDTLGWDADINLNIAGRPDDYIVAAQTVELVEGECAFIDIPEGAPSGPLTVQVGVFGSLPINPLVSGYNQTRMVMFYRKNGNIESLMEMPDLDSGEISQIGVSLPAKIRARLGILSETSFVAYTSNNVIAANDNYAIALSKLDAAIFAINSDEADEEIFLVTAPGGQTVFNAVGLSWSTDHNVPDIQVTINGVKYQQSRDGNPANEDFVKTDADTLTFNFSVPQNAKVVIRDERTGGGGGGGGGDLTNITVDPQPATNGGKALGQTAKAWSALYLKDTSSAQVYKIEMVSGTLTMTPVP